MRFFENWAFEKVKPRRATAGLTKNPLYLAAHYEGGSDVLKKSTKLQGLCSRVHTGHGLGRALRFRSLKLFRYTAINS